MSDMTDPAPLREAIARLENDAVRNGYSRPWAAFSEDLRAILSALPTDAVQPVGGEPVAWSYDLATIHDRAFHTYDGWKACLSASKPNAPEGSVRNLTPLYATAPTALSSHTGEDQ